ncbi:MAG: hypothetical protein COU51_04000 [Parcubacteria group bacterium CG10_big_fil_rev_8_21_14_0_10_36_14]|nr:MAG: hypothetical protein COU51_04000 [Parcubacteria group bacterium CG10_big_fil_rev_8_21_14_0_10_36_14]
MQTKKTIFITISRGSIAKNFLHNEFYEILKKEGWKIIILSPAFSDEVFRKEFGEENIFFEPLYNHKWNLRDYFFAGLNKALVYNESTVLRDKYGIMDKSETSAMRRILKRIFFKPLSKFGFIKEVIRYIDFLFCPGKEYYVFFQKYSPDIVFSTNPMDDADSYVLKAAKRFGVKIIAMPKSWDNLSKMSFRVKPEKLFLWGSGLIKEAKKYQNIDSDDIFVVGIPQFDVYSKPMSSFSREEFFKKIGVDPKKEILVLGSDAKYSSTDIEIAEMVRDWINKGELEKDCILFIRPYFSARDGEKKFEKFLGEKNIIIDHWFKRNNIFRDSWDYSYEHMEYFSALMMQMTIMMNYSSTLTIDAAVCDKPIVGIAFDGYKKKEYGSSVARWYDSTHFKPIVASGGIEIVKSPNELKIAINGYLKNSTLRSEGREKLRNNFCYKVDGQSGKRIAEALISL